MSDDPVASLPQLELLEREADRRAVDGVDKPIIYKGEVTGTYKEYSDNLLMFRMKKLCPEYRDSYNLVVSDDSATKELLAKLKELGKPREIPAPAVEGEYREVAPEDK